MEQRPIAETVCPQCKNGEAYLTPGAHVVKCTRCGKVFNPDRLGNHEKPLISEEASTIGLAPGVWPQHFEHNGRRYTKFSVENYYPTATGPAVLVSVRYVSDVDILDVVND